VSEEAMTQFLREFLQFLRERRTFWLVPIVVALLAMGALMLLAQDSALAPFVYSLF
jgi:hypothetical protein